MAKIYFIEDNDTLLKVFKNRFKEDGEVVFIDLKELARSRHEIILKKQKIVVDISRNHNYIAFCNDLKKFFKKSFEGLHLLVNYEQFSELKHDLDLNGRILKPQNIGDIVKFIS